MTLGNQVVASRSRVLVVTHEASRTGAPRVAVEILRALASLGVERVAALRWGGPLEEDFREAADRVCLEPLRRLRVALRRFRRTRSWAVAIEELAARRVLTREKPELVYLNTVKSACYVRPAIDLGIRVVLHAHESGSLLIDTLARYRLEGLYDRVRLVACSEAAAAELKAATGAGEVVVIRSAIDLGRVRRLAEAPIGSHAGEPRRLTVGACGTADEGKGTDLWLEVAKLVKGAMGEGCPRFVWIGAGDAGPYLALAKRLDVDRVVQFVAPLANPYPLLASLDILTVTSREDAFPLVVLEAMALGVPVVAFDAGGIAEGLGEHGIVVSAGDVDAMAEGVVGLLGDEAARKRLAASAAKRAEAGFGIAGFRRSVGDLVSSELARSRTRPLAPAVDRAAAGSSPSP